MKIKKSHICDYGGEILVNVNKLKGKMVECGFNIKTLSQETGIKEATMLRRFSSSGEDFSIKEADAIAKALGLNAEEVNAIFFSQFVA